MLPEQDNQLHIIGQSIQRFHTFIPDGANLQLQAVTTSDRWMPFLQDVHDVTLLQEGNHLLIVCLNRKKLCDVKV